MKGFAMLGLGKTGWIEKDAPQCGPLDAIVRPLAVSPCTSDVHTVWQGAIGERHDMILGHEAVGEVVEVGKLVKDFKPGDKVVVPAITPDWGSLAAQDGFAMHSGGALAGWKFSNFKDGVFADFFHVNEADANMALLVDDIDPVYATLLCDMMPTGFHAAELAQVKFGDNVCVIGIGPVGLCAVRASVLSGAANIYAVGTRPNCVEVAKQYGATHIISYKEGSIAQQILDLTKGEGVDKVIVAGGDNDTFIDAVTMLKPGGIIGNVNYLDGGEFVRIPRIEWGVGMGHKFIHSGLMPGGRRRVERLMSLISTERFDPKPLITHKFDKFEQIEDALMLMKDKVHDLIKPVVSF
ncbi:NAD(P)-dependent alcohol dehydrogenase [Rhodobacteraceae bacterium RKSG542]|uniref:NAD(P)-dependent alcohol dehydrogenase n=1 Tax=Pseudovibrio flavus TaxID=2529854 RepID=UPI0012BD4FC7|nr:NAD(P)-dependent alcohol dehydrogenase [Pseudovibrio flavus]MTI18196.1 NAD(P)-dependent alcohol dehydrogenase [Pseudovibrio flavus]